MLWNGDQSPRVKKERKPTLRGKWESVFSGGHKDNVPKETHAVSVMTHKPPGNSGEGQRRKGRSSSLAVPLHKAKQLLTARDKNHPKDLVKVRKALLDKSEIPCRFKFCKNSVMWILASSRVSELHVSKRM